MSPQITKVEGLIGGISWSICLLVLAFILGGAGHGWISAIGAAICSLILIPVAGYNYANPKGSRTTAEIVLIITICVDLYLLIGIWAYGIALFLGAYKHLPVVVFAFSGMWIAWHILPILAILRRESA